MFLMMAGCGIDAIDPTCKPVFTPYNVYKCGPFKKLSRCPKSLIILMWSLRVTLNFWSISFNTGSNYHHVFQLFSKMQDQWSHLILQIQKCSTSTCAWSKLLWWCHCKLCREMNPIIFADLIPRCSLMHSSYIYNWRCIMGCTVEWEKKNLVRELLWWEGIVSPTLIVSQEGF